MYSPIIATAAIALAPTVLSFKNTSPLLIYSLVPNTNGADTIRQVGSSISQAEDVYRSISTIGCSWDSLAVIRVDGLHHSHIPSFSLAPEDVIMHVPYLLNPSISTLDAAIEDLAGICGADIVDNLSGDAGSKEIIYLNGKREDDIASIISNLDVQPNLVIFTGTPSSTPTKRQDEELPFPDIPSEDPTYPYPSDPEPSPSPSPSDPQDPQDPEYPSDPQDPEEPSDPQDPEDDEPSNPSPSNRTSTIPPKDAPLLQRVQLLTTPLITSLLIGFFVFIPIVSFGVSALVGIQVPPRMLEISKSMVVGKDKKDQ